MAKLLYQGHASFRIVAENGMVIYIDPFAGRGYDLPADLILVTHQHKDHNNLSLVPMKVNTKIIQNFDLHPSIDEYLETTVMDVNIRAVPAYNKNHPKDQGVGYVLKVDGVVVYHSGDTSLIPEMNDFQEFAIDYALLCGDGKYNMSLKEAQQVSEIIGACFNVPMHLVPGELFDHFIANAWKAKNKKVLEPGQEITLKSK